MRNCALAAWQEEEPRRGDDTRVEDAMERARRTLGQKGKRDGERKQRQAYALTISGIFWQEYQSWYCVKEGERWEKKRGRTRRARARESRKKVKAKGRRADGSLDVTSFGTIV